MRLPNFLSTVSNRASLSITPTLYDRRALDCTACKPLVQSLQRLMVLTSTSSRVRETLCQDGGLERLVQIMKESHHPDDTLAPCKWHLCMQCLVNLSARGSETVRMRVLEAGAIPVIATILDNYLVAHGDSLEHRDRDRNREGRHRRRAASSRTSTIVPSLMTADSDLVGAAEGQADHAEQSLGATGLGVSEGANGALNNYAAARRATDIPSAVGDSSPDDVATGLPAGGAARQANAPSFEPLPVEPRMAAQAEHFLNQFSQATGRAVRSRRAQNAEELLPNGAAPQTTPLSNMPAPLVNVELEQGGMAQFVNGLLIPREQDVFWALEIIAFVSKYSHLRREMQETHFLPQLSLRPHEELLAYNSTHSLSSDEMDDCCDFAQQLPQQLSSHHHSHYNHAQHHHPHHLHHHQHTHDHGHEPREDDSELMLGNTNGHPGHGPEDHHNMGQQSLDNAPNEADRMDVDEDYAFASATSARLSKDEETRALSARIFDDDERAYYTYDFENEVDFDDEYLTRPVNLFELVERFTAFRAPREFPHWACIIMRNFVRKDEGGIRQCANFACGKWEEYPRQFAKCRRCKRTKYCSKACQLKAWSMHRYWCAPSPSSQPSTATALTTVNHSEPAAAPAHDVATRSEPSSGSSTQATSQEPAETGPRPPPPVVAPVIHSVFQPPPITTFASQPPQLPAQPGGRVGGVMAARGALRRDISPESDLDSM